MLELESMRIRSTGTALDSEAHVLLHAVLVDGEVVGPRPPMYFAPASWTLTLRATSADPLRKTGDC
jgi:hypothetical protein